MRRPNILFINRVYPPVRGATGRVLRDLAQAFAREGWHVTIITSGPNKGQERDGNIRIVRVKGPERPKNIIVYLWIWFKMLVVALRLKKRFLVVTMTDPPFLVILGALITKIKKSRHIHWCQDLYPDILPAMGYRLPDFILSFLKFLSIKSMHGCDKVIVCGRCMARQLAHDGINAKKITMIPNWPETHLFQQDATQPDTQQPFHTPEGGRVRPHDEQIKDGQRFRVLYAGNLGKAHTINTVLDAAERLEKDKSDVEFVFVGEGERFDYIAAERARRHLENIRLLPYQPDSRLREMLESGDVHIITMKDEAAGFVVPSKLYASLAVARPVIFIGPKQTESAKVIKDFNCGDVIANKDKIGLVKLIKKYRTDGDAWFSAHNGAVQARNVFTAKGSMDAWIERAWGVIEDDLKSESKG